MEISDDGGTTWHSSLTITPIEGLVGPTTILARIAASATVGTISDSLVNLSPGATSLGVVVTGAVTAAATPAVQIVGGPLDLGTTVVGAAGVSRSYLVSGSNLRAGLTIVAPSGVELSGDNGATWSASLTIAQVEGSVSPTTILARISGSAPTGTVSGAISNATDGASTQVVAVEGTVVKAASSGGSIVASEPQVFYGEVIVFTATFTATKVGSAPMTGTVDFYDGTIYLGRSDLYAGGPASLAITEETTGRSSLATSGLHVGEHLITAIYSGDANYETSTSQIPVSVQVEQATTVTSLAASTSAGVTTLTATVTVTSPGNPTLNGLVSFYEGSTLLGTAPVSGGVASLSIPALSAGYHALSAVFSGEGDATSSGSTAAIAADGPKVVGLSRYGFHASPSVLALVFDSALDPSSAENVANYQIVDAKGRRIAVNRADYDPATLTVTLSLGQRLDIHRAYTLTLIGTGPGALANTSGVALDGNGGGQPGSNFTAKLTWKALTVIGKAPAITFVNGQPHATARSFNAYVSAIVRAAKAALQTPKASRKAKIHTAAAVNAQGARTAPKNAATRVNRPRTGH